jgi:hypothetical protein
MSSVAPVPTTPSLLKYVPCVDALCPLRLNCPWQNVQWANGKRNHYELYNSRRA